MKIYLDDVRPTPPGWVRCYWPEEIVALYEEHGSEIKVISFDHDLGDDEHGTGETFLKWLEEHVYFNRDAYVPQLLIHSDNPEGRKYMHMTIKSILRYKND